MKHLGLTILCAAMVLSSTVANAGVTNPRFHMTTYDKMVSRTGETSKTYEYVMSVYHEYTPVLNDADSPYSDRQQAVSGLTWLFPYLLNGAFYHSEHNDRQKALSFAEAYIDTYINPAMKSAGLEVNETYPTLVYFAASNNYNQRNYDKAILYLDAYIKSGDTKNLTDAFNYTAKAYINTNRYDQAKQMLVSGLELFPTDLPMLTTIINLLAETKSDDTTLRTYVTQALRYKPDDIGLLNIQAQLYERAQDFDNAASAYRKLMALKPQNLEVARHLGINLYNSGVHIINSGGKKSQARGRLNEAAGILSDVVVSDPLAVNYLYALANTYSILGDRENLEKTNSRIVMLGREPVAGDATPRLLAVNNTHITPTSVGSPSVGSPSVGNSSVGNYDSPLTTPSVPSVGNYDSPQTIPISDVDTDIPVTNYRNNNTFAVIIANNDYRKVADVADADNDGRIFAEYCNKVLGIPQDHIRAHYNVTYGELLDAVEDIKSIARAKRGNLDVIFYYAGHGVPDEQTKSAHILPVDADGKQMRLCYPLSELYSELGGMNANNTFVFLDACFSGATRSANDMLLSARSVAIDVDPDEVDGKLVIFSAATGDQTALSYDGQHHGMFTYFLLKRLKETKGKVDLGTLADYLTENVSLESQLKNKKQQIPTVIAGNEYGMAGWKGLRLTR